MQNRASLVSVDVLALRYNPQLRRVEMATKPRTTEPFLGKPALPGVLLQEGERLAAAAHRAVTTKVGFDVSALGQLTVFDQPNRDPRGYSLSVAMWAVGDGEVSAAPVSAETYYLVANLSTGPASVKVTLLFEDGSPAVARTFAVGGNSRFNVSIRDEFPAAVGRRFGGIVESLGAGAAPLVVERAMYSTQGATMWAAGSNTLATRLQ